MPARPKVVLSEHLDDEPAAWLTDRATLVRQPREDAEALQCELADADGLIVRTYTQVTDALLAAAPRLWVVARAGVGLDNIDLAACRRRGIRVVHTPEANTQAVVEYVTALMLDACRPRRPLAGPVSAERFHELRKEGVGRQLDELTLGVLGVGRIGRRIAQVAAAIGMRVLCHDVLPPDQLALPAGFCGSFVEPGELWAASDVLTVHVDGRAENRGLIGSGVLGQLKSGCLLINTSRGFVVDPAALAEWAQTVQDWGGGAVLDVHEPEPPPGTYPLFGLENVTLLPHLASRTGRAMANMSWVVRDLVRVLDGEEPEHAAV